ncbi:hypothetical protein [Thomasclavelia cocleata]|uniref:hypothetical protein n=1 Tax=Thomasclavelia cocleata TaxID=69824 RepID=UPI00256F57E8|nr:hypothetical protein [Thomasclavelia cocleata]
MKRQIESKLEKVGNYMVLTEEYDKHGLFFQFPIKKVNHDADNWDYDKPITFSAYDFAKRCEKSKVYRFLQIILGNKTQVENIKSWLEEMDFGGCTLNTLVSPIIFKRRFRELTATAIEQNSPIKKIHSIGYEAQLNDCNGACEKEITTITGLSTKRLTYKERFHYTYKHIVESELLI